MLIVHPLSTCDVCLDEYSFVSAQNAPHAIACGHIFCNPCLNRLHPRICPLCRTHFSRDAVTRLHVDRRPLDQDSERYSQTQLEELELLQRLALASGEDTPEEELAEVILDVEAWLEGKSMDMGRSLRKAVSAIHRHKRKDSERRKGKEELRMVQQEFRRKRRAFDQDIKMAQTVEQSLLEQLQNVESQHRAEIEAAQRELDRLRQELARLKMRSRPSSPFGSNPLPPPPKPFGDDIIPDLIDKGKGVDGPPNHRSAHDTTDSAPGNPSARSEGLEASGHISRAASDEYGYWYPHWWDSEAEAQRQAQSSEQNGRSLSVVPGARPEQRVVLPLNVRGRSLSQNDAAPEMPETTLIIPGSHQQDWGADTIASAERQAGLIVGEPIPGPSRTGPAPARDATQASSRASRFSINDFALTQPPTGGNALHFTREPNMSLRSLLGVPFSPEAAAPSQSQESVTHNHPSSLRPGTASGSRSRSSTWDTDPAAVSNDSLGSLNLGRLTNPNIHDTGLGLQLNMNGNVGSSRQSAFFLERPATAIEPQNSDDDALELPSSDDDDDEGEAQFFTPRASSSNALLFNNDAARRSGPTMAANQRSHSRPAHESGAVTDVESTARSTNGRIVRPAHGRFASHQVAIAASSGESLINQQTVQHTPHGHRTRTGRRTSAPDPPPPTISFIPPPHHSRRSVAPQNPSAPTLTRTAILVNMPGMSGMSSASFTGAISLPQQGGITRIGAMNSSRDVAEPQPQRSNDYSRFWTTAPLFSSSRNLESTARQR